jgi:dihydrofolate reductase
MGRVIWSIGISLDGFIAGPDGEFDWAAPGPELHAFHNEQTRELGVHLLGRRLYETMVVWETDWWGPDEPGHLREFAEVWRALPKVVFSTTLTSVEGNARLARGSVAEEIAALREQVDGDIAVGGAGLAAACVEADLVDEYRPFVNPVVAGGGTPYLPPTAAPLDLELLESRTFPPGVSYLRYRRR